MLPPHRGPLMTAQESRAGRLITSIDPADTRHVDSKKNSRNETAASTGCVNAAAPLSPSRARRFPFSAPLRPRRAVFFGLGAGKWGDRQMKIIASGRLALLVATGLFVCFAGPSQAAPDNDGEASATSEAAAGSPLALNKYVKRSSRQGKKHAPRKSGKAAEKSDTDKKPDVAEIADSSGDNSSAIPSWLANANAQLANADTPTGNAAKAMSARASEILQNAPDRRADAPPGTEGQGGSADQLNDVDRALHGAGPTPPNLTLASVVEALAAPAAPAGPVMAATDTESSTWDQTSLIGKIFIGFGA